MMRIARTPGRLLLLGLLASPATALGSGLVDDEAAALQKSVDALAPRLSAVARDVWGYAELGFKETRSTERLQKELKAAGFKIETGVAGQPTAFIASAGSGKPVIALLAEYDALPGLSQSASPVRQPVEGRDAGHACGHNLLGAASVTAGIALSQWLKKTGHSGTVRVYGTPAEEGGGGKVYLVREGYFDDVDATLSWHPGDRNGASQGTNLAMVGGKFRFSGTASHAAAAPDRGRSALDGVEVFNVAANYLREHVPLETRIHYVITKGGGQPNVVPADAEVYYYVRHYEAEVVADVWDRVNKAAQGAALATGTSVSVDVISAYRNRVPNDTLGRIADESLRKVGGYEYTAEESAFAAQLQKSLLRKVPAPDPETIEPYALDRKGSASSDVGDVSWVTPTVGVSAATFVRGTSVHSWQASATAGTSIGTKGALVAAKTLTLTGAELFLRPEELVKARAELEERRGGGFRYSSLIGDRKPPLDYTDRE